MLKKYSSEYLIPPEGAIEKIRLWAAKFGKNNALDKIGSPQTVVQDLAVVELLESLDADFNHADDSILPMIKVWDGKSAFTPLIKQGDVKATPTSNLNARRLESQTTLKSVQYKYFALSLIQTKSGGREVEVTANIGNNKKLDVLVIQQNNAPNLVDEQVVVVLRRDNFQIVTAAILKVLNDEIDLKIVRYEAAPDWARNGIDAMKKQRTIIRSDYRNRRRVKPISLTSKVGDKFIFGEKVLEAEHTSTTKYYYNRERSDGRDGAKKKPRLYTIQKVVPHPLVKVSQHH